MPLPGGLWWLLCCRRGFTLLHRDYGDGELSGDGDEDEDEETFELRTPSPAGGGRVSPGGLKPGLNPSPYRRPSRRVQLQTPAKHRAPGRRAWERILPRGQESPGAGRLGCACGPRAGCCPPAGALGQGGVTRGPTWPCLSLPRRARVPSHPLPPPPAPRNVERPAGRLGRLGPLRSEVVSAGPRCGSSHLGDLGKG